MPASRYTSFYCEPGGRGIFKKSLKFLNFRGRGTTLPSFLQLSVGHYRLVCKLHDFLFLEGMNVTVINDRSADYIRNQLVIFDRKWVSQMRFFFGTEFDRLFIERNSVGKMLDEELVLISIKDMELALMGRLKNLSEFVEKKEGEEGKGENEEEKSFLYLIY